MWLIFKYINLIFELIKIEWLSIYNINLYKIYMIWVIIILFWGRYEMYDVRLYKDKIWYFLFFYIKMLEIIEVMNIRNLENM